MANTTSISQDVIEAIVDGANASVSQFETEAVVFGANASISQLTIELVRSNDITPPVIVNTARFNSGLGSQYWVIPQLTDSTNELRSKTVKSARVTSKRTNSNFRIYPYDVNQDIVIADMEDDVRTAGATRSIDLPDSDDVSQSARKQVNCVNAVLSTIRVAGDDRGNTERDRIDEIVLELAIQGARR